MGKPLPKKDTPTVDGDHPEEDTCEPLDDKGHQQYQMVIGMLNWIVCIGRMDVAYVTALLSRFTACPRKGHMDRAYGIQIFEEVQELLCAGPRRLQRSYSCWWKGCTKY